MSDFLKSYDNLVEYLGQVFGDTCEIALQDCSQGCIRAIANGHISGRNVGAPLTDLARRMIHDEVWKTTDYVCNYEGHAKDGKILRSSTYFIKKSGKLLGMFCINIDTTDYETITKLALKLGGFTHSKLPKASAGSSNTGMEHETFYEDINEMAYAILYDLYGDTVPASFTPEERLEIIKQLNSKGVFLIKGSVSHIAVLLKCSEASLYRYLAQVKRTTP